ncbi:ATP-binding protein [Polaromonas sp.]|uniref:ATP-binding protein n=1 Tax=Polaromonas sp. TaxID=1869339 RepID=UPI003BACD790
MLNPEFPRPVALDTHPIILQRYIVPTPSIEELYLSIRQCLKLRVPGAIIYAMTRWGKTYASRFVTVALREDFPHLVIIAFDCHKKKIPSESAFFSNLLRAIGHEKAETGSSYVKRVRLLNKLMEMLQASKQNVLVVFADEAQKLEIEDYEWLREVHDELERSGFRMVTFLIGQPQLKNVKTAMKAARQTQIVGRFMIDDIEFHGVRSAEEGASCLLGYDTACYPNDDWPFTRFFFPQAWATGLRLVEEGATLWQHFQEAHDDAGFRMELEVPMTYFARTVEIAITELGKDHPDFRFTPEIWRQAVKASRFSAAEEELLLNIEPD